jgi:hypothetical protein
MLIKLEKKMQADHLIMVLSLRKGNDQGKP